MITEIVIEEVKYNPNYETVSFNKAGEWVPNNKNIEGFDTHFTRDEILNPDSEKQITKTKKNN
jgi:hypothetical protein